MFASLIKNCTTKPFPDFIRHSNALYRSDFEINKIFPKIGLPNAKESIDVKFDFNDVSVSKVVHLAIKRYLTAFREKFSADSLKSAELFKVSNILYIFEELSRRFTKGYGLTTVSGKVKLTDAIKSYDGTVLIKKGTDCFDLVKKLLTIGEKYAKIDLVSNEEIEKECKNLQIAFSSSELEGAWDLATMSMRGVKSCMRWEARQSRSLVGSITDPCCGIIYLTNGARTQFGPKMLFRALVRLVFSRTTGEPALLVDRVYSSFYKNRPNESTKLDCQVRALFVKYLRSKTSKIKVIEITDSNVHDVTYNYYLAKPPCYSSLAEEERSYLDIRMDYAENFSSLESNIVKKYGVKTKSTNATTKKVVKKSSKNKTTKSKSSFLL